MTEMVLHQFGTMGPGTHVAIVGFPSLGLVSSIATNFLSRDLKLDLVAGLTSSEFPPYALIQGGRPMPPIRIFSGCRDNCGEGLDCGGVVVVTTEFAPKPDTHRDVALALLDWFEANGVDAVVTLDGIPMFVQDRYDILGAASTPEAREMMVRYGVEPFEDGMVRGISGVLLYEGSVRRMKVMSIMGTARSEIPDPKGAANLLETIKKMLPEVSIDTDPLYAEAAEIDKRLKAQTEAPDQGSNDILYG